MNMKNFIYRFKSTRDWDNMVSGKISIDDYLEKLPYKPTVYIEEEAWRIVDHMRGGNDEYFQEKFGVTFEDYKAKSFEEQKKIILKRVKSEYDNDSRHITERFVQGVLIKFIDDFITFLNSALGIK